MKSTLAIAALATALLAGPAFADCAGDLTKIDEAMKSAKLDEATTTKVKTAYDTAKAAQTANDATACETATKEIMTLLGMPAAQ